MLLSGATTNWPYGPAALNGRSSRPDTCQHPTTRPAERKIGRPALSLFVHTTPCITDKSVEGSRDTVFITIFSGELRAMPPETSFQLAVFWQTDNFHDIARHAHRACQSNRSQHRYTGESSVAHWRCAHTKLLICPTGCYRRAVISPRIGRFESIQRRDVGTSLTFSVKK